MQKLVIIVRGVAGSGKSTWVKNFPHPCTVVSTDNYFIAKNGLYIFDRDRLHYYHQCALNLFTTLVDESISAIIVDNTNIKKRDYKKYVSYARSMGYTVVQKVCCGEYGSIHDVAPETVERMKRQFQVDESLPHYEEIDDVNT